MSALLERLRVESRQLSPEERCLLGEELLAETEPGAEAAWNEEILRRVAELENGTVTGVPLSQVMADLRAGIRCGLLSERS